MAKKPSRRHRIEVRVTPEQDVLIRQAAHLEHTTVTSFALATATAHAASMVERHHDTTLSNAAFDRFISALDGPAEPVSEISELFQRHPKLPEE